MGKQDLSSEPNPEFEKDLAQCVCGRTVNRRFLAPSWDENNNEAMLCVFCIMKNDKQRLARGAFHIPLSRSEIRATRLSRYIL